MEEVEVKEIWSVEQIRRSDQTIIAVNCSVEISKSSLDLLAEKAKIYKNFLIDYLQLNTYYSECYYRDFDAYVDSTNYLQKIQELQQDVREFIEKVKCVVRELKETIEAREQLIEDIKSALPENKTYIIS